MTKTSLIAKQSSGNLNFSTVQKMIHRLLTHDRIKTDLDDEKIRGFGLYGGPEIKVKAFTKEELVKKLGISSKDLERLESPSFYKEIASKISLPLILLYCATKFVDGEYRAE
jgi:hypothetical protein